MTRLNMMLRTLLVLVPAVPLGAAEPAIRDGDVMVFVGDYVTEEYGGAQRTDRISYPSHVESFLTVRYPNLRVTYYNVAMAGATAPNTVERFDRDIRPLKPTVGVICLGLQEAGMKTFDEAVFAAHKEGLRKLIGLFKAAGARVYVLSPPSVDEHTSTNLKEVDYNSTLSQYAAAQREIATAEGAQYVDWFGMSVAVRDKAMQSNPAFYFSPDGLRHTNRSHGLAATLLLQAFKAEPIVVNIRVDWKTGKIESDAGRATLKMGEHDAREIHISNLPIPWPTMVGPNQMMMNDWETAEWCRYMLKVDNGPSPGLLIASEVRQIPVILQQVQEGLNLMTVEPLRSLPAAVDLSNLIRRKNYTRVHAWRDQELSPVKDPELRDAQQSLIKAWYQYFDGYNKIIARTPKSFDLNMKLLPLNIPTLPSLPSTRPDLPAAGRSAATRPALQPK